MQFLNAKFFINTQKFPVHLVNMLFEYRKREKKDSYPNRIVKNFSPKWHAFIITQYKHINDILLCTRNTYKR